MTDPSRLDARRIVRGVLLEHAYDRASPLQAAARAELTARHREDYDRLRSNFEAVGRILGEAWQTYATMGAGLVAGMKSAIEAGAAADAERSRAAIRGKGRT